jgi:hypothetical protein
MASSKERKRAHDLNDNPDNSVVVEKRVKLGDDESDADQTRVPMVGGLGEAELSKNSKKKKKKKKAKDGIVTGDRSIIGVDVCCMTTAPRMCAIYWL